MNFPTGPPILTEFFRRSDKFGCFSCANFCGDQCRFSGFSFKEPRQVLLHLARDTKVLGGGVSTLWAKDRWQEFCDKVTLPIVNAAPDPKLPLVPDGEFNTFHITPEAVQVGRVATFESHNAIVQCFRICSCV